jgi:hypothetical protein
LLLPTGVHLYELQDESVSTDDLLMLLASFGRAAPAGMCQQGAQTLPPTDEFGAWNREYLFCSLRDRVAEMLAELQATVDEQAAAAVDYQATVDEQAAAAVDYQATVDN